MDWYTNYILPLYVYWMGLFVSIIQLYYRLHCYIGLSARFKIGIDSQKRSLSRIAVVTGGTSGIGQATVDKLAELRYEIIVVSEEKPKEVYQGVTYMEVDLASLKAIEELVGKIKEKYEQIDLLINCAGVMFVPLSYSELGIEKHFSINYLGHFALTLQLMDLLQQSKGARIINITSSTYILSDGDFRKQIIMPKQRDYSPYKAYVLSKLAMLLFTYKLQRNLVKSNVTVFAYDPGTVNTNLFKYSDCFTRLLLRLFGGVLIRSPSEAANDLVRLSKSASPLFECYMGWKNEFEPTNAIANSFQKQDELWKLSFELTGIKV